MAKKEYYCTSCETVLGRKTLSCPKCKNVGTIIEKAQDSEIVSRAGLKSSGSITPHKKAKTFKELKATTTERFPTGIRELDRVLGGGFVESEVILFAGTPGAGKALASNTLIPMADESFKPLREVIVGDFLVDMDGLITKVLKKFYPTVNKAYRLFFSNGGMVEACEDHLWSLYDVSLFKDEGRQLVTVDTNEISLNGVMFGEELRWAVPIVNENLEDGGFYRSGELNYITSIVEIPVANDYQCIMVDSPTKTFLCTQDLIPTHNSTLSLSIADAFARSGRKVLYSSGEESEGQISLRAQRMKVDDDNILITNETSLETILGHIEAESPDLLILDSLQTIASTEISGSIGSVQQSKEAAHALTRLAKDKGIMMLLVSQVVKSGETVIAGSNQISHIVDCVITLESDHDSPLKLLRASKNRFGDTGEIGLFLHTDFGLMEVENPMSFLGEDGVKKIGASRGVLREGERFIPFEVESLVSRSFLTNPRRQFSGVQFNRTQIICAALDKYLRMGLYEKDIYISTLSGLKVDEPLADLAIAASVISTEDNILSNNETVFLGEITLTGYIRSGVHMGRMIKEAVTLGFQNIVVPKNANIDKKVAKNANIVRVEELKDLRNFLKNNKNG